MKIAMYRLKHIVMATQKGLITITGTIGGFNFYEDNGKNIARRSGGGFNGEAIKTKPEMVRVRENSSEFGMVSKAKKVFRLGLYPFLKDIKDITLHGRMMSLFQTIKVLDTFSERGKRIFQNGLTTDEGRTLLQDFAFTPQKASSMLPGVGIFDPVTQQYTVSDINLNNLRLPKGASGMQVYFGVLVADFDAETSMLFKSNVIFIDINFSVPSFTLTPDSLPSGSGTRISVLQVRYYQEVNGKVFLFYELGEQGVAVLGVY